MHRILHKRGDICGDTKPHKNKNNAYKLVKLSHS